MASPVGHTLGAYAVWIALNPQVLSDARKNRIAIGSSFIFGNLADADFAVAHFTTNPVWGHHYFSHTIFFAVALTLFCVLMLRIIAGHALSLPFTMGCAYGTHLLLDFFTADGSPPFGIPLLWPFSEHHFLFSPSIFYSTHRGSLQALFSVHNATAMLIELALLSPVVLLVLFLRRK